MKYTYKRKRKNSDGTEWWIVRNNEKKREVSCNSESACKKIIHIAHWTEGTVTEPPDNHTTLHRKARYLVYGYYADVSHYEAKVRYK